MLFPTFTSPSLELGNHIVIAPMTRNRAVEANTPSLIITEGTSPSPNGLGYARIPGLFNALQVRGWKPVTDAVHAKGGKIFVQLMRTGRVSHTANLPAGAEAIGPMANICPGEMYTDAGRDKHAGPEDAGSDWWLEGIPCREGGVAG